MPSHQASSAPSFIPRPATRKPLGALLNCTGPTVMQRKSRPTCALSVANVSACTSLPPTRMATPSDAMNVDSVSPSDVDVSLLPVPISPRSPEDRSKAKAAGAKPRSPRSRRQSNQEINVIPFPTSAQTSDTFVSVSPPTSNQLSTHHALLRTAALPIIVNKALSRISSVPRTHSQIKQKLESEKQARSKNHEAPLPASSAPPPRKRARKGSLSSHSKAASPRATSHCPSKDASLITEPIPPRPSSPTPEGRPRASPSPDAMMTDRNGPPPYTPSPPPYSPSPPLSEKPSLTAEAPATLVIHAPKPVRSSATVATPPSESAPCAPSSAPVAPKLIPPPQPPSPPRRFRISNSEAQMLIDLHRTLVVGIQKRKLLDPHPEQTAAFYRKWERERAERVKILEENAARREAERELERGPMPDIDFTDLTATSALLEYFNHEDDFYDGTDMPSSQPPILYSDGLEAQDYRLVESLRSFLLECGVSPMELGPDPKFFLPPCLMKQPPPVAVESLEDSSIPDMVVDSDLENPCQDDLTVSATDKRRSSPPPITKWSSPSYSRPIPPTTHLIALFTMRARARPRHRFIRPKPRNRPLGPSSLRNQVQLDVDPFAVVIEEEL